MARRYRGDTLVLKTPFETENGAVSLDFMPPRDDHSNLVRLVVRERGRTAMRVELVVRSEFVKRVPANTHQISSPPTELESSQFSAFAIFAAPSALRQLHLPWVKYYCSSVAG